MSVIAAQADQRIHRPDKIIVLAEALASCGIREEAFLQGTGLDAPRLREPSTRVSVRELLAACANAQRLAPHPRLAFDAGARTRLTHFGLYGYALLASPTARQAIDFALKYRALASPLVGLSFHVEAGEAVWRFEDALGVGERSELFRFLVEIQLGTQLTLHRDVLGTTLRPLRVRASYPAPAHAGLYTERLDCPVEFGQPANELRFDAAWLEHAPACSNPITAAAVRETCDQHLAQMQGAGGSAARVMQLLLESPGRFPPIESVASQLGCASRTLRRRLQDEGTSYQQVLDDVRRRLAVDYLERTRMGTEDIAAALGFSDAANFRRAFRRWTGQSPLSWRCDRPASSRGRR